MQANINLNFLYFLMATATTSAVPPLASSVLWARCSKIAALSGKHAIQLSLVMTCFGLVWKSCIHTCVQKASCLSNTAAKLYIIFRLFAGAIIGQALGVAAWLVVCPSRRRSPFCPSPIKLLTSKIDGLLIWTYRKESVACSLSAQ